MSKPTFAVAACRGTAGGITSFRRLCSLPRTVKERMCISGARTSIWLARSCLRDLRAAKCGRNIRWM